MVMKMKSKRRVNEREKRKIQEVFEKAEGMERIVKGIWKRYPDVR